MRTVILAKMTNNPKLSSKPLLKTSLYFVSMVSTTKKTQHKRELSVKSSCSVGEQLGHPEYHKSDCMHINLYRS